MMESKTIQQSDQRALWNGAGGQAWVESQALLDRMLEPFEHKLVASISPKTSRHVLDVGCGTGSTTLAIAQRLGEHGRVTGVDISEPMLAAARIRVQHEPWPPAFVCADAQVHAFEPSSFDTIVSRFGVMFFEDPVAAFANLHRAALPSAQLSFVAWRNAEENPFMTAAERAAAPLLPNLPVRRADAPGQFAFGDAHRVRRILEESGWTEVALAPLDVTCGFPEKDLIHYVTRLGPVGRVLQDTSDDVRAQVIDKVRAALASYVEGPEVRFTAACWLVTANKRR